MTSGTTTSWQPVLNWGWRGETEVATGYVSYSYSTAPLGHCTEYYWKNFTYHDPFGTPHYFAGEGYIQTGPVYYCRPQHDSVVATATDGSGYSINANPSATGSVTIALTTSSGKSLSVPQNAGNGSAKTTDRNGNEISTDGSGNFYDTLSSTAATLVVSGTGTVSSPQKFTYTTSTGGSAYYQVNYTNYTVATNFGISGITEYKSAAAVPLVTGVELPDTSQYTFTYETTPGTCAPYSGTTCVTARLKTVTLPTGGMITYTYSGGYDGIFSDGSAAGLMRQTPDGTWTYNRTLGTGSNVGASATLITAPMLSYETNSDQTIEQFQGIYPTQTDVYQGTAPSFSSVPISQGSLQTSGLLQETQTCYNGSANP